MNVKKKIFKVNMSKSERIETIINIIQKRGYISPVKLSQEMGVSIPTIRRDLKLLRDKNIIKNDYNNIRVNTNVDKIFHERHSINKLKKEVIAKLARDFIKSEDTIFLDTSTTCYELARQLVYSQKTLFIVTNNLYTAIELLNNERIDVVLIGGNTKKGYFCTVGPFAEKMIANIKVDKFFFSCTAFDEKGTYEPDKLGGNVKLKFLENSRIHYLLADSSKFNKASISKTADIDDIDVLITEKVLPDNLLTVLKKYNIQCVFPSNKNKGK